MRSQRAGHILETEQQQSIHLHISTDITLLYKETIETQTIYNFFLKNHLKKTPFIQID